MKTKATIPYLSQFAIIAKNKIILFLIVLFEKKTGKQEGLKPTGLTSFKLTPQFCLKDQTPVKAKVTETDSVMEIYEPFLLDDLRSLMTLPSLTLLKSYEILELLNLLFQYRAFFGEDFIWNKCFYSECRM